MERHRICQNGTCVKYSQAWVKFSRIKAKITFSVNFDKFRRDFPQINWSDFAFEQKFVKRLTICSKQMSKTSYIFNFLPKISQFSAFFGRNGKFGESHCKTFYYLHVCLWRTFISARSQFKLWCVAGVNSAILTIGLPCFVKFQIEKCEFSFRTRSFEVE